MNSQRNRYILIGILIIVCIYMNSSYSYNQFPFFSSIQINHRSLVLANDHMVGWISSSLYRQFQSYSTSRDSLLRRIKRPISIENGNIKILPLSSDYIQFIENTSTQIDYPYSNWECSNTSNTDFARSGEYCILTNIYYNSALDEYYFYQNPAHINRTKQREVFMAPNYPVRLTVINNSKFFPGKFRLSSVLTRPNLVSSLPDANYAHGFLETCGPRFWTLAECQYHASYINPSQIQIYLTSKQFQDFPANWNLYKRRLDGTYEPTRKWEKMIQSMFSRYPILTYKSFNRTNVMFKYLIFTGLKWSRSASWGYSYLPRKYRSYPMSTQHYRRAYLAFSEWILNNFHLPSKFELTKIEKELQVRKTPETIPICNHQCLAKQSTENFTEEYTGEWIVVLNRAGRGKREITNADELVQALLRAFPDHSNPYLRVWPKQFNFNDNLYETARFARSIRLLIGVHGAGLSNALFMRPGAILFEINPYGCRDLSFNFHRWAEVFNLQHALWIPSYGENGRQDDRCRREAHITVNAKEIIDEVQNMLKNEMVYRSGYLRIALNIMTDLSIVDYPPKGYEDVLS